MEDSAKTWMGVSAHGLTFDIAGRFVDGLILAAQWDLEVTKTPAEAACLEQLVGRLVTERDGLVELGGASLACAPTLSGAGERLHVVVHAVLGWYQFGLHLFMSGTEELAEHATRRHEVWAPGGAFGRGQLRRTGWSLAARGLLAEETIPRILSLLEHGLIGFFQKARRTTCRPRGHSGARPFEVRRVPVAILRLCAANVLAEAGRSLILVNQPGAWASPLPLLPVDESLHDVFVVLSALPTECLHDDEQAVVSLVLGSAAEILAEHATDETRHLDAATAILDLAFRLAPAASRPSAMALMNVGWLGLHRGEDELVASAIARLAAAEDLVSEAAQDLAPAGARVRAGIRVRRLMLEAQHAGRVSGAGPDAFDPFFQECSRLRAEGIEIDEHILFMANFRAWEGAVAHRDWSRARHHWRELLGDARRKSELLHLRSFLARGHQFWIQGGLELEEMEQLMQLLTDAKHQARSHAHRSLADIGAQELERVREALAAPDGDLYQQYSASIPHTEFLTASGEEHALTSL